MFLMILFIPPFMMILNLKIDIIIREVLIKFVTYLVVKE